MPDPWTRGLYETLAGLGLATASTAAGWRSGRIHELLTTTHSAPHHDLILLRLAAATLLAAGLFTAAVGTIRMIAHRRQPS